MWAVWTLLLWWADYFGRGWLLVWLVARLCFVLRLPATNGQGWVMRRLVAQLQAVLELVPAHWRVELGLEWSWLQVLVSQS